MNFFTAFSSHLPKLNVELGDKTFSSLPADQVLCHARWVVLFFERYRLQCRGAQLAHFGTGAFNVLHLELETAVPYITQIDRNNKKTEMAWFDGNFEPVEADRFVDTEWKKIKPGVHRRPECWKEMLSLAQKISLTLKTPFVSVDCFSSSNGPVVGELTFAAGGPYYGGMFTLNKQMDEIMGGMWSAAAIELGENIPQLKPGPIPKDRGSKRMPLKIK